MTVMRPVMGPVMGSVFNRPFAGSDYEFNFGGSLPPGVTLTRASTGGYFDSAGVLQSAANDVARFNYNPSTLALEGLLNEPARTNGIRNNTTVGGVAGSPGTAPTLVGLSAAPAGVTRTISFGTEDGFEYIDVSYAGTPTSSSALTLNGAISSSIAGTSGQTFTNSMYGRLVAGSFTNVALEIRVLGRLGGGSTSESTVSTISPTSAALRTQRYSITRTMTNPLTVTVDGYFAANYTNALPFDFTLRIGLQQIELGSDASSPIKTSSAAVTRAADVLSLAMIDGTYDIDITRASGVTNVIGAVVSGGSYTVPTDLSPLQSVVARRVA